MIKACEKASKVIIRDFGEVENLQVKKKGPKDFVTKTDKRVEKILIEELKKSKKNYSFISEETGTINNSDENNIWIIDRIDSMFVVQFGELCGGGSVELVVWITLAGGSLEEILIKIGIKL